MRTRILIGDALERLREMPDQSVQCIVTSPPYYGVRDYKADGQIGLEATPQEYIDRLVAVFAEARRVLRDDGTLWLNVGDSYAGSGKGGNPKSGKQATNRGSQTVGVLYGSSCKQAAVTNMTRKTFDGIKAKDLIGIPWMLAFAFRDDGWWLRGDQIWAKPNGMPESVTDRPTRAHEYVFLFAKSARYFYDQNAVRLKALAVSDARLAQNLDRQTGSLRANGGRERPMKAVASKLDKQRGHTRRHAGFNDRWDDMERAEQIQDGANLRSVWCLPPAQFDEAHYAVMPDDLAAICIAAGSPVGATVLDPFGGAGTTAVVAERMGRNAILIELNPEFAAMAERRLEASRPGPLVMALEGGRAP